MAYDVRAVANCILDIADALKVSVTHMQLQKVVYFSHGWHLALFGDALIANEFCAWKDGPVVPELYECFKHAGPRPIGSRAFRFDLRTRSLEPLPPIKDERTVAFIHRMVEQYGRLGAFKLSDMMHVEGGPWDQVRNAAPGLIPMGMRISNDLIQRHFVKVSERTAPI